MLYEYGGHLYDNDGSPSKATVNSDAGVKAMTLWYNAIKAGSAKPIPAGNFADRVPETGDREWRFVRSDERERMGKLVLREDVWRLPTGVEKRYPILQVGLTVGVVPCE